MGKAGQNSVYAQVLKNTIVNTIVLNDPSLIPLFSDGYQYFVEIDQLDPEPGIGWAYDGQKFSPPPPIQLPLNQQYTESEFGQFILDQLNSTFNDPKYTSQQLFQLVQATQTYYILLQTGSLQTFLDNIGNIPVD